MQRALNIHWTQEEVMSFAQEFSVQCMSWQPNSHHHATTTTQPGMWPTKSVFQSRHGASGKYSAPFVIAPKSADQIFFVCFPVSCIFPQKCTRTVTKPHHKIIETCSIYMPRGKNDDFDKHKRSCPIMPLDPFWSFNMIHGSSDMAVDCQFNIFIRDQIVDVYTTGSHNIGLTFAVVFPLTSRTILSVFGIKYHWFLD